MFRKFRTVRVVSAACALALAGPAPARAERHEAEPAMAAVELARPALLSGPDFRVRPQAQLVGFMAAFTLDTGSGPVRADSVELLEVRAAEMAAIQVLDDVVLREAFGLAALGSVKDTGATLARVAVRPLATVAGVPAGVLRYFRGELDKWSGRLRRHGDRIGDRAGNAGDPYAMVGPMNAGRDERPRKAKRRWYGKIGRELGRQAEDAVSHGSARRTLARELGIDPYAATSNPALNERLDRLAWAAAAGSMSVTELLGVLPTGARAVLDHGGRIDDLVWDLDPEDLRKRNHAVLSRWCGDDFQMRRFVRHGVFLASVQTRLASAVDAIGPAAGCEHLLDLALAAGHEVEARFLANGLVMASDFLGPAARGSEIVPVGAGLVLVLPDGRKVLPLPVDRLSWTALAEDFFDLPELADGPRSVLVGGDVSDRALRELTALGWEIVVRTPYAGAPAYARTCCA
jgi:hypothetical protein